MFLKGSSSEMGVYTIPAHLKTRIERIYQVAEKEEDDLHAQEGGIFYDSEDDTITSFSG